MKWLPPPSEPRCVTLCASRMAGCLSSSVCSPSASPLSAKRRATAFGTPSFQPPLMPMPPCGTAASMPTRSAGRLSGRSLGRQRGAHRHHAAADVDADRCRHDRRLGGDHRADGGALAEVHVRHDGDVVMDEGQRGDVEQLAARRVLDGHALDPGLDRRIARLDDLRAGHDAISFRCWSSPLAGGGAGAAIPHQRRNGVIACPQSRLQPVMRDIIDAHAPSARDRNPARGCDGTRCRTRQPGAVRPLRSAQELLGSRVQRGRRPHSSRRPSTRARAVTS